MLPPHHPATIVENGKTVNVHAGGAAGDSTALLHAVELAAALALVLALHVVIVVVAASSADEEGRRQQRRGAGADLLDGRDILRQRCGIDEDRLVEPGREHG